MGVVYRVRDEATGELLALKMLETLDARAKRLFEREYHTLASLKHPRVIAVCDFGIASDGRRFYTMELLEGADLLELAPLPYPRACSLVHDIATCLALLHARRLLHRDVSPGNVRLDAQGRAKLLDFGALGDFGVPREVVGTPAYMPIESVHGLPLDQRSDLFSLGATLFFALTGRAAFEAQRIEDIALAQRRPPPPPSAYVRELPRALDQLVLSLLNRDPQRRPSSAAEVMDRLAAIADLDTEPLQHVAESHLLSSAFVGRASELSKVSQLAQRAQRGEGAVAMIAGVSGMGRSRLASELAILARISGMISVRIDALAHPEPLGSLSVLGRALLELAPLEAASTLAPHAHILGQVFDALRAPGAGAGKAPLPKDSTERRLLIQRAFAAWILALAEARPLLLVVDDVHALDSEAAGLLALLAYSAPRAPLLLLVTQERDALAPAPIQLLTRVALRIDLEQLERSSIDALTGSVFGDVPHRTRLTEWLVAAGRCNPGHSLELLKLLVDRGVIRYVGGAWVLPAFLPEQELPSGVDAAWHARLQALGPDATRLARMFALQQAALPLQVCLQLTPDLALLDRLVGHEILLRAGGTYRFAREALRESTLRDVPAAERAALHRALAHALMQARPELLASLAQQAPKAPSYGTFAFRHPPTNGSDAPQEAKAALGTQELCLLLEVAGHLERAGDARGCALQREVAIELTMRGVGLNDAVRQLEAAVAEQRALGRPSYELGALLVPLCLAGTYCDYRLSYRYGIETLDILLDLTGLRFATRLRPWLGGRAALALGLLAGFVRFSLTGRARVARSFRDAMLGVMGIGTALLGTFSVLVDKVEAQRVSERLDILRHFPEQHPVRCVHTLQQALFDVTRGEIARACDRALATFHALAGLSGLREEARLQLQVGCLTPVTLAYSLRVDGKAHDIFDKLDRMPTSVSRQIAAGGRAVYHGHRGEHMKYLAHREEMDLLASQAGSTWREDVGTPRQMWNTYLLAEDVLGLKRAASDLDALAELPSIRKLRDVTRACYLCERGQADEALALYRDLFEASLHDTGLQALRIAGAYARILRCAGEPARAKQVCSEALARAQAEDRVFKVATFTAELELMLSTAAVGQIEEALAGLDQLLAAQRAHDNPLLHGLAHKARALLAIQQHDRETFELQLSEMEAWFGRTENPALIAQCQRLMEQAQRAGVLSGHRPASGTHEIAPSEPDKRTVTVRGRPTR